MKREKLKYSKMTLFFSAVFVITETVLYMLIHTLPGKYFSLLAYLSIVLAAAFSFISVKDSENEDYLIRLGMLFTLGADYCLVVMSPAEELMGVIIFIFTQLSYFLFILIREEKRTRAAHIIIRFTVSVIALIAPIIVLGDGADALSIVSVFYYAQLVLNVAFSLLDKELRLFSAGLILFALCDLSIGLTEIASTYFGAEEGTLLYNIANSNVNLAWVFYLPSQTLIPLSLLFKREKNRKKETV